MGTGLKWQVGGWENATQFLSRFMSNSTANVDDESKWARALTTSVTIYSVIGILLSLLWLKLKLRADFILNPKDQVAANHWEFVRMGDI